jgi:hypothetical protein
MFEEGLLNAPNRGLNNSSFCSVVRCAVRYRGILLAIVSEMVVLHAAVA